jgi:hypothetical protein
MRVAQQTFEDEPTEAADGAAFPPDFDPLNPNEPKITVRVMREAAGDRVSVRRFVAELVSPRKSKIWPALLRGEKTGLTHLQSQLEAVKPLLEGRWA